MRITRRKDIFVNTNRRYSLRKLSVGLTSVLICLSFANVTKVQTVKADSSNKVPIYLRENENTVQNDAQQPSSDQNSASDQPQKNLLDDLGKQKASTQSGDQAEAQENRLVDKINYKLTSNSSTDNKEDLRQNLIAPDETQPDSTTKSDAEKSSVGSSSTQKINNQSNDHADDSPQTQNSQKLDLTKNSKRLAKKVLATNLIETNSLPMTNGGFDEATWGKLDVTKWQGSVQDGVYQLTGYTGDSSHIIVPNEADFEQAGKSTNGLQVGITRDTVQSLLSQAQTIAFSKTNNQKVKAIGTDWSHAFVSFLSKFDGSNLDVSNVTDMNRMFYHVSITDLTSLTNWDTSNVTSMSNMFNNTSISDLTSLTNWNVSKVTDMSYMFENNSISDLTPLTNWNVSKVIDMSSMFDSNKVSDLKPLTNWDVNNVTDMSNMFDSNKVSDLKPLTNWNTSKVTNMSNMFENNSISNLTPLADWDTNKVTDMREMFENNSISNLTPLADWDTNKVTDMREMFENNSISDLTLLANWNVNKVTYMSFMFANNPNIIDLKPIANWNISNVAFNDWDGNGFSALFAGATKLDLTNINNTSLMQGFLKEPDALGGTTFITNNANLVKATTGKDLPTLTNTAKRTITFNIPHAEPKIITQIINYKDTTPAVQIDWSAFEYPEIGKPYSLQDSDWQLDTSKQNDDVIIDGVINFKSIKIPHINGYKAHLIKDSTNPAMFLVSFIALPQQSNQSTSNNVQSSQKIIQAERNQPEPIQTVPVEKQKQQEVTQIIDHIAYELIHNDSNANSFEPAQSTSDQLENASDSTPKDDAAKIVNIAKHKKHTVKKCVVKRHKKHAKKYHLKRRSKKHTKRSKKRIIKDQKKASRKFRKYNLKKNKGEKRKNHV